MSIINEFTQKISLSAEAAKCKVQALRKDDSLVFPIFTDIHSVNTENPNIQRLLKTLELITKEIPVDFAADLGDNAEMLGRDMHISNADLSAALAKLFEAIAKAAGCPILHVNGNHDGIGTDFFKPDFWNGLVKHKYGNTNAVYDKDGSYYYVDFDRQKTRIVVLSAPCDSELEAEYPTPVWAFGNAQIEWLEKTALDTEKSVIILSHVPFYYKYSGDTTATIGTWNGEKATVSYRTDLCGRLEDCEKIVGVINAFAAKDRTKLVACLSGHMHTDFFQKPMETVGGNINPLPCHQIVTTGVHIPTDTHREYGVSVDIAVWTPSEKKLSLIRVGDGEDREVSLK